MSKKLLLLSLCFLPALGLCGYAAPVTMDLFGGGLSLLDTLLLIAIGLLILGTLFLCIAFLKPVSTKEDAIQEDFPISPEDLAQDFEDDLEAAEDSAPEPEIPEENPAEISDPEPTEPPSSEEEPLPEENTEDNEEETSAESIEENPLKETPAEEPEPEEEPVYPKLILTDPESMDFKVLPLRSETTIGRKTTNDLVLNDTTVSGIHCRVLAEKDAIYLEDLGSTNGTYLNGERLMEKTKLHRGDKVTIGKQTYSVSINE